MESRHVINVARRGQHFFRVEVPGYSWDWKEVAKSLTERYPQPEFEVSVTWWEITGREVLTSRYL